VDNIASLVVRAGGDASSLSPSIRRAIWSVDRNQPIARVATMDALIARSASQRRFASVVFEAFALTALILAAMGLYGVISSGVVERTREIGIRVALGATSGEIVARIVISALLLTFVGVLLGIGGGFLASRMLESLLFGITRADPLTYAGVIALLTVVAAVSCWSPARRAASVDPAITLRSE
jgi:ABC-type antimicrobial peptide transport system permease subunit